MDDGETGEEDSGHLRRGRSGRSRRGTLPRSTRTQIAEGNHPRTNRIRTTAIATARRSHQRRPTTLIDASYVAPLRKVVMQEIAVGEKWVLRMNDGRLDLF